MAEPIELTGTALTPGNLAAVATGAPIALCPHGLARMARTRAHLLQALEEQRPIYGVTTGLGPRVVERLSPEAQLRMSRKTVRGRAHAVGAPLDPALVRAAMAVRANTFLIGASGVDPALAELIAGCLNAGLSPVVRETGSVGAADLMWGGNLGLGLIGEGEMMTPDGVRPAAKALAATGLAPYQPGPREGLALVSHSCVVAAVAAIGVNRTARAIETTQTAAALSLEGFRGNLTPFSPRVLALRPQPGQMAAAAGIMARLEGSTLNEPGTARRVQDPLSLRNIVQVHGTAIAALGFARTAVEAEINGASDNPVVLEVSGDVLSSGGFLTPHLAVALGALGQGLTHLAAAQVARTAKLMNPRFSDLPVGLVGGDIDSAGMAPAMKSAEALYSEIVHLAQHAPVYPGGGADSVEDIVAHSAIPAKALLKIVDRLERLSAMELMVAAQAVELRDLDVIAPTMAAAVATVRKYCPPVTEDRALSDDIEALAARVAAGDFAGQ